MVNSILILHGWGSCAKNWNQIKELLEKQGYKVFIPDLPGFGLAPEPPKPWSVDDYVEYVKNYSEKEGVSQFFLLGHSFGGRIAIKFAVKYPEKISKLVLIDTAGVAREKNLNLRQKILIKLGKFRYFIKSLPILKIFYPIFRKIAYILAGTKDYYLIKSQVMKETFKKIISEDLTPYLSEITSQTLIVWGEKDKLVPLKNGYLIKEKITRSQLEIIPEVGHSPHLEATEKLVNIIVKFLRK